MTGAAPDNFTSFFSATAFRGPNLNLERRRWRQSDKVEPPLTANNLNPFCRRRSQDGAASPSRARSMTVRNTALSPWRTATGEGQNGQEAAVPFVPPRSRFLDNTPLNP